MKYKGSNKLIGCFRAKDISPLHACAWLLLLLLASCGETVEVAQPELPVGTPVSVTADLQVSICPIAALQSVSTRGEEADESDALGVSYLPTNATRADVDKTVAEKEVKNAYVVQFNGVSPTSTAVWVSADISALLKSSTPVTCGLTLTKGVKNRMYVVANPKSVPTVGMTLQAFETVAYTLSTSLPSTGLPMAASQDVEADGEFGLFLLKSPLARLTFTTSTGTSTLKNIPSAYSLYVPAPGDEAVRPLGVTYTTTFALTSGTTYYVPANLSGRVVLSDKILRCSTFAPANAMYVTVSGNSTTYTIYLGDGSASDFNVAGNYAYTASATIGNVNSLPDMRVGTPPSVTVLDGSGTANCYIVPAANTWYSFSGTVMGNGKTIPAHTAGAVPGDINSPAITPTPLSPASASVLWETWNTTTTPVRGSVVRGAYIADGKVIFRSGSKEGNAVIAIYKSGETDPCWSWHIWRTNATPATQTLSAFTSTSGNFDATGTTTLSGLQIMDRNLGALSATVYNTNNAEGKLSTGLHYQWGRKDPMPSGADFTSSGAMLTIPAGIPVIPGSTKQYTIEESIQQPTTFFMLDGDWCRVRNDNLWGTPLTKTVIVSSYTFNSNDGAKSIYDPCPVGWRVPPGYAFANATKPSGANLGTDKGYSLTILTSGSSWFPGSGQRQSYTGKLHIGAGGYYRTSTVNVSGLSASHFFYFDTTIMNPNNAATRAYGLSVRCAKE